DDFKLRAIWSEDIRAPIISELFAVPQYNRGSLLDPKTGKSAAIFYTAQGNPNLVPEEANNVSAGIVFTPTWIQGLSASLDYYSINIKKAIYATNNTQILNQCTGGNAAFCQYMFFGAAGFPTDYPG